jgi:hypothetical protein
MLISTMHSRVLSLAICAASILLPRAASAMVNGSITVNGTKYELKNVYAFKESAKADSDLIVVLTDASVPMATVRDTFGLIHLVQDGKVHGLKLTLRDKQCISGTILDTKTVNGGGVWGNDMIEVDSIDNGSLVAHAFADKPHEMFGNTFAYNFRFVTSIETPKAEIAATPAQKKEAENSEQGKLYRQFVKAVNAMDIPALRKLINKQMSAQMSDPKFPEALAFIKSMMPTNLELQTVKVEGESAKITAEGKDSDGKKTTGVITFVKEGGEWKIGKESWKTAM